MKLIRRLWNDDCGITYSAEVVAWTTLVGIGLIVGIAAVRDAIVEELNDVANAISHIDQSYSAGGFQFDDGPPTIYTVSHEPGFGEQ